MHTALIDCDGVLADFVTAALELAHDLFGVPPETYHQNPVWEITDGLGLTSAQTVQFWDTIAHAIGFAGNLKPYPGAQEGLELLRRRGARVLIVTAPLAGSPTWAYEREKWLMDHFDIRRRDIIQAHAKEVIRGDLLVDDKPDNVTKWFAANRGHALLWDQTYNRDAQLKRVTNWEEVADHVGA